MAAAAHLQRLGDGRRRLDMATHIGVMKMLCSSGRYAR